MENEQVVAEEEKKEVQRRIIELPHVAKESTEDDFLNILRLVSPGTNLRTALEGIAKAGKGALIVVENEFTNDIIDGGFKLNCRFTPQKLIELSKMDGAIVLSKDMKKIMYANVLLTPDSKIPTNETGTRHKAAERAARMTGTLVMALSERRNETNIYYKNIKHNLVNSNELLRKSNEQLQLLEKQRDLFDKYVEKLDRFELQNYHNVQQAVHVIQKGYFVQKIAYGINKLIIELGKEGTLLKTRLKELLNDVEKETDLVVKDYTKLDLKKSRAMLETLSYDELLEKENVIKSLAYENPLQQRQIKGWRILSKTLLSEPEIALLTKEAGTLGKAINSNISFYKDILGEEIANKLKEEIERIKLNYSY